MSLNNPKKGVFLCLKFLLGFWSYNDSLKIKVHSSVRPAVRNFSLITRKNVRLRKLFQKRVSK